jgi:hypothetical protein
VLEKLPGTGMDVKNPDFEMGEINAITTDQENVGVIKKRNTEVSAIRRGEGARRGDGGQGGVGFRGLDFNLTRTSTGEDIEGVAHPNVRKGVGCAA